jgi:hypothetical protein
LGLFFLLLLLLLQRHSFVPLVSFYLENRANHRDQTSQKSPESSSSSHWNSHATLTRGLEVSIDVQWHRTRGSFQDGSNGANTTFVFIHSSSVCLKVNTRQENGEMGKRIMTKGGRPPFATWCANVLDWNVYNKSARLHRVTHKGRERINRNKRSAWPSNEWWTRRRNGAWTWSHARTLIVNTYISVRMQRHDLASTGLKEKQSTII